MPYYFFEKVSEKFLQYYYYNIINNKRITF